MNLTDTTFIVDAQHEPLDRTFDDGHTQGCEKVTPLAEVKAPSGSVFRFIEEGHGPGKTHESPRIGVVEMTSPKVDPVLPTLLREYGPSPLEIYLAVAGPQARASEALIADHRRAVESRPRLSPTPRPLSLTSLLTRPTRQVPAHLVADVSPQYGVQVDYCTHIGSDFHFDFRDVEADVFGAQLPNHGHGHDLEVTHYGVTGFSSRRVLGVCNGGGYPKTVTVQFEWLAGVWVEVPIAQNGGNLLFPDISVVYYSDSWPVIYRYRIKVVFSSVADGNIVHTEGSW